MRPLPPKILVVEDNADDEALLMHQLKKAGLHAQVKVIADGGEALAFLMDEERGSKDLVAVLLDLGLPNLTGLRLLKAIRKQERTSHLPVILMTSSNDPRELERCSTLGVSAFVPKPITLAAFTKAIADTFHSKKT